MAHPKLTPADIREAFQAAIPHRQDEFREAVRELKRQHTRSDTVLSRYIHEVARLAKRELRARYDAATRLVEKLIDDGWVPAPPDTIESVYQSLFAGFKSVGRNPIEDLKISVGAVYGDLGGNTADIRAPFDKEFQETQVNAYRSAVAALKLHRPGKPTTVFSAPVGFVQIGDNNTGMIERRDDDAGAT